jgi:hypothetical protein
MCATLSVAQSLGDAAREHRNREVAANKPKANLTLTNDEVARRDAPEPAPNETMKLIQQTKTLEQQTKQKEGEIWKAKITDARARVARLEAEVKDLEARQNRLYYPKRGDPVMNPISRSEAIKAMQRALEDERSQLSITREELDSDRRRAKVEGFNF